MYGLILMYWMDGPVGLWVIDEEIGCQQMTGNFKFVQRQVYVRQARDTNREKLLTLDIVEHLIG